jgi:hypothetical protein
MTWKIDHQAKTVQIVISRSCLGNPAWIRAGAGMTNTYGENRYDDDGLTAAPAGQDLVLGPKLYP